MSNLHFFTASHIFDYGTPFGIVATFEEMNQKSVAEAYVLIADLPNRQIRQAGSIRYASAPAAQHNELPAPEVTPLKAASDWLLGVISAKRFEKYQQQRHFPFLGNATLERVAPTFLHHLWLIGAASAVFPQLRERSRSPELQKLLQAIMDVPPYEIGEETLFL